MRFRSLNLISLWIGILASLGSICLWIVLVFFNPYASGVDAFVGTLFMLCLPSFLAFYAAMNQKNTLMLIAFVWSAPFGLYFTGSPGIFRGYGFVLLFYFLSWLLMVIKRKTKLKKN